METGFMDRKGKMYVCQPFGHMSLAQTICEKLGYLDEIRHINHFYTNIDCENYLIAKGFLGIYSRCIMHGCFIRAMIGQKRFPFVKLSKEQERFIKDNLNNAFNSDQLRYMYDALEWNETVNERNGLKKGDEKDGIQSE